MKKKAILILLVLLAAVAAAPARAEATPITLLISGNELDNDITVGLTPDGREYLITSTLALEVGGDICAHPGEVENELVCRAPAIAGFEVNGLGGSDFVVFSSDVPVPATIRGGSGDDRLLGGGVSDKIIGGPGNDLLGGRRGDDWLLGGPGDDRLVGGPGNDFLRGGLGADDLRGGPGQNDAVP